MFLPWIASPPTQVTTSQTPPANKPLLGQKPTPPGICPAQLPATLNRVVERLPLVRWGIVVQTMNTPARRITLYAKNPDTLLIPASNNKLFTTAAALQKLGPQYRMRTSVMGSSTGNNLGSNLASLRIIGRGDPSLKTSHLTSLAQQLRQRGIRQVELLIGDDTYYRGAAVNPNWDRDDTLAGYGAPVNSLMLNQNGIGLTLFPQRVGQPLRVQWEDLTDAQAWRLDNQAVTVGASQAESVDAYRDRTNPFVIHIEGQLRAGSASEPIAAAIANPGNYLIQKFRNVLTAAQISVTQATVVKTTPGSTGEVELASVESPPLTALLQETNQESNNIYAETLLKTLGKVQSPNNTDAMAAGIAAVQTILTPLGIDPTQYRMVDGSGLSDRNRASATALSQTLQAMAQSPHAAIFRASLPTAGASGTLKNRFRGTAVQGRLQAKTGTIAGVVSLSGYLTPPNYPPLVLGLVANDANGSAATIRAAMDELVVLLTRLRSC